MMGPATMCLLHGAGNALLATRPQGEAHGEKGEKGEKGEGIRKDKLVVTKQSQGCKVQHGSRVDSAAVTMCSAWWVPEIPGKHFGKCMSV